MISFTLNGKTVQVDRSGDVPLLYALRSDLGRMATRFGCGQEQCGACVVLVSGIPRYACTLPLSDVEGATVATADGLAEDRIGTALINAFEAENTGQCGYCLSGILMRATALLAENPAPTDDQIAEALDDHLCRCGAHPGIIKGISRAARTLSEGAR